MIILKTIISDFFNSLSKNRFFIRPLHIKILRGKSRLLMYAEKGVRQRFYIIKSHILVNRAACRSHVYYMARSAEPLRYALRRILKGNTGDADLLQIDFQY